MSENQNWLNPERKISADGWMHQAPGQSNQGFFAGFAIIAFLVGVVMLITDATNSGNPSFFQGAGLVIVCFVVFMFVMCLVVGPCVTGQYNYCPTCARRTPYDTTQERCLCGYRPGDLSKTAAVLLAFALALAAASLSTPLAHAGDMPVAPSNRDAEWQQPQAPIDPYEVHDTFFTKDRVEPEVTPEFLDLVNKPSFPLAVKAYQKQILNIVTLMQGIRYYEAVRAYYEERIESQHKVRLQDNPQQFYRLLLQEFGYQDITVTLPDALKPFDPMGNKAVARLLRRMLERSPSAGK